MAGPLGRFLVRPNRRERLGVLVFANRNGDPFWGLAGTRWPTNRRATSSVRPDQETGSLPIVAAIRRITEHGDDVIHAISPPIEPLHQNALPASFGFPAFYCGEIHGIDILLILHAIRFQSRIW